MLHLLIKKFNYNIFKKIKIGNKFGKQKFKIWPKKRYIGPHVPYGRPLTSLTGNIYSTVPLSIALMFNQPIK